MLVQEAFRLEHGSATTIDFQASDRGVLFATVDWTHASNNVVAVLADQGCASVNLALAGNCDQGLTFSEPSTCTAKPRILTASIAAGRPVRLYVANAGASAESGRVEVTLCRDSPGCESGMACGQCEIQANVRGSCP
jgi:hypothetical protein